MHDIGSVADRRWIANLHKIQSVSEFVSIWSQHACIPSPSHATKHFCLIGPLAHRVLQAIIVEHTSWIFASCLRSANFGHT
jgi:hypothetical protein